jgi:hypothetical protein
MTCCGLEWCTLAALAEAQRAIKRPKANTERIASAPIDQPPVLYDARAAPPQSVTVHDQSHRRQLSEESRKTRLIDPTGPVVAEQARFKGNPRLIAA